MTAKFPESCSEIAQSIRQIQNLEREKLSLIAALHLEQLHAELPGAEMLGSSTAGSAEGEGESAGAKRGLTLCSGKEYATSRIEAIEEAIREALSEIQACKMDLVDG